MLSHTKHASQKVYKKGPFPQLSSHTHSQSKKIKPTLLMELLNLLLTLAAISQFTINAEPLVPSDCSTTSAAPVSTYVLPVPRYTTATTTATYTSGCTTTTTTKALSTYSAPSTYATPTPTPKPTTTPCDTPTPTPTTTSCDIPTPTPNTYPTPTPTAAATTVGGSGSGSGSAAEKASSKASSTFTVMNFKEFVLLSVSFFLFI